MNQNARLLGDEITKCRPTTTKDPENYDGREDWWECYKVDLACVRTLALWRDFVAKWKAFLEPQTVHMHMTPAKVRDLARFVRDFHHERVLRDDHAFRRVLAPQVFTSIEMVRMFSRKDPSVPPPPWGAVFEALCRLGYLKLDTDTGQVYLDQEMLGPTPQEKIVRADTPGAVLRIQQQMLRDRRVTGGKGSVEEMRKGAIDRAKAALVRSLLYGAPGPKVTH